MKFWDPNLCRPPDRGHTLIAPMYTFWDSKRNRWERDAGLRIDYLLLNPKAAKRLVDAGVDREVRGLEGASDHAPAWIVLRNAPAARRSRLDV
jgi:exonuclease III